MSIADPTARPEAGAPVAPIPWPRHAALCLALAGVLALSFGLTPLPRLAEFAILFLLIAAMSLVIIVQRPDPLGRRTRRSWLAFAPIVLLGMAQFLPGIPWLEAAWTVGVPVLTFVALRVLDAHGQREIRGEAALKT